ncbi:MAG: GxxExxY protein [Parachlamydiales bacterium]
MPTAELLEDPLTHAIIGAAIEVHRELGSGLLESTYEACLIHELRTRGLGVKAQQPQPVCYKGVRLDCGYRLDVVVEGEVVVEVKAVDRLTTIHEAQLLSYLKLSGCRRGLLINFNVRRIRDGIKRFVL